MTGLMVHSINITFGNREIKELPVMMMKAMAGSLEDWTVIQIFLGKKS